MTPDGKPICFSYNSAYERCARGKKCRFLHVCSGCFEKGHNFPNCSKVNKSGGGEGPARPSGTG